MGTIDREERDYRRWQAREERRELQQLEQGLDVLAARARDLARKALIRVADNMWHPVWPARADQQDASPRNPARAFSE
jgi:hypothetical protein